MLKQGLIEFDLKEIQNIHRQQQKKKQQQRRKLIAEQQQNREDDAKEIIDLNRDKDKNLYSIVRQQIFPTKFTPFFIDTFSKQSSMQLYQFRIPNQEQIKSINQRLGRFYQIVNSYSEEQRKKLMYLLQLDTLERFTIQATQSIQLKNALQGGYFSYFVQGKSLGDVESWCFKHKEDDPHIAYQQRLSLFNDLLLLLKFIHKLQQTTQFSNSTTIQLTQIMVLQHQGLNQKQNEKHYRLGVSIKWPLNLILGKHQNRSQREDDILIPAKKMLIKLLSIQEQQQKRTKLQQLHFQQIDSLKSFQDIFKLKYNQFYPNMKQKTQQVQEKQQQSKSKQYQRQRLSQIKQQILKLEEKAKQQMKQIKITNQNPRINFESQQSRDYFFNQIKKIILKNLTDSQTKTIILACKKSTQTVKKQQPSIKDNKSIVSSNKSTMKKTQQKQTLNKSFVVDQHKPPQQLAVETKYLCSASDLRFRPDRLISLIQGKQVLYVMEVFNKAQSMPIYIGCYVNAKLSSSTQGIEMFGSYIEDQPKKSFIYSYNKDMYFTLIDKNHAVGYGPQIFLSIGKLDIIIPCFGTQMINKNQMLKCMSYFPISYSPQGKRLMEQFDQIQEEQQTDSNKNILQEENKIVGQNKIGLEKQFFLAQIDIYEVNFKVV